MTLAEIKADADMAETWPGSGALGFNELSFEALAAWAHQDPEYVRPQTYDVESVKAMFQDWWRKECEREGKR